MYAWNFHQTRELEAQVGHLNSSFWVIPIVHGAFLQRKCDLSGRMLNITVIARRSRHFAGTRYVQWLHIIPLIEYQLVASSALHVFLAVQSLVVAPPVLVVYSAAALRKMCEILCASYSVDTGLHWRKKEVGWASVKSKLRPFLPPSLFWRTPMYDSKRSFVVNSHERNLLPVDLFLGVVYGFSWS